MKNITIYQHLNFNAYLLVCAQGNEPAAERSKGHTVFKTQDTILLLVSQRSIDHNIQTHSLHANSAFTLLLQSPLAAARSQHLMCFVCLRAPAWRFEYINPDANFKRVIHWRECDNKKLSMREAAHTFIYTQFSSRRQCIYVINRGADCGGDALLLGNH